MNVILYARVSTDKQADKDLSIPAQLQAMRDYARQHEWTVVQEFLEPGASAKTADRPALQQLLATVRDSGTTIDVVLVHKIDRLARNVYDHATIRALLQQRGVRLASVVENMDDSISGQLVENIMASIAQFYSANLGDEARKGMRQKVLNGGWPHKAPRGYATVRNEDGRGSRLELHRRDGALIRSAFELYATGHYAVKTLAQRLAKDGLTAKSGRPVAQSYLRRILANPFYAGRIKWGGLDVAGAHPPLVSGELFERVRAVIDRRYRDPGVQGTILGFPLRGVAICASCRTRMTGERHDRWFYYRCGRNAFRASACPASLCNAAKVHADLEQLCQQIRITSELTDAIAESAGRIIEDRVARAVDRRSAVEESLSALTRQEMQTTAAFTTGDLSPNLYRVKGQELRDRRAVFLKELAKLPSSAQVLTAQVARALEVATSLWDLYNVFPDPKRAELVAEVFGTVVIAREGIAGFTLKPPFDRLASAAKDDPRKLSASQRDGLVAAILDAAQPPAASQPASASGHPLLGSRGSDLG